VKTTENVLAIASPRLRHPKPMTASIKPPSAGHAARDRSNLPPLESGRGRENSVRVVPVDSPVLSASAPPSTPAEKPAPLASNPPAVSVDSPVRSASALPSAPAEKAAPLASNPPTAGTGGAAEKSSSPPYVRPRALHGLRTNLSPAIRAMVTSEVELRIKVQIDDSGRVTEADTLTASGPATRSLLGVTEKAARLWEFAPAMRGSEPVPSEAIVVFRFRPLAE
jgi:outer membrane biosynthesis protein TonB